MCTPRLAGKTTLIAAGAARSICRGLHAGQISERNSALGCNRPSTVRLDVGPAELREVLLNRRAAVVDGRLQPRAEFRSEI
jgi:hypothetical protein